MAFESAKKPEAKMSAVVGDEYSSSLADLTVNSKPLINMLTILADESIEHAAVIVQSVEKHLDKVQPEIKLPVLYLVDSIIKNVGGAYTQLFSQIIVNMFCKVFKQVDEKTRSQMFKLRETWHDVFPAMKLYQLDVKVNLVDPAWPIQARPPQTNIHVNPNFLGRTAPEDEEMRAAVARKEQELLQLQKKKIEMELEKTRMQLLEQRKVLDRTANVPAASVLPKPRPTPVAVPPRIAPVGPALISSARRRDPRLSRQPPSSAPSSAAPARDPRLSRKGAPSPTKAAPAPKKPSPPPIVPPPPLRIDKLPPIPKLKERPSSPTKRKKESPRSSRKRTKKSKENPVSASPPVSTPSVVPPPSSTPSKSSSPTKPKASFKELKGRSKDRNYMRRNREHSPSPPTVPIIPVPTPPAAVKSPAPAPVVTSNGGSLGDVDLRTLPPEVPPPVAEPPTPPARKRSPSDASQHEPTKKSKSEKLDALFGAEDVDLRTLGGIGTEGGEEGNGWASVKELPSPVGAEHLASVRAKLAEATRSCDPLGRPRLFSDDTKSRKKSRNSEDTDMRQKAAVELDGNSLDGNIKIIMTQAEEQLKTGNIDKEQYNVLLMQVLELNERQKLREAMRKESLEASKRRLQMLQQEESQSSSDGGRSPSPAPPPVHGDIDERLPPRPPLLALPDLDMRLRGPERYPMRPAAGPRGFRGGWRGRPEWGGPRGFRPRGPPPPAWRTTIPNPAPAPVQQPAPPAATVAGNRLGPSPLAPYITDGRLSPPSLGARSARDPLPPVPQEVLDYIARDTMKTIAIDGVARDIRFYGTTAVVMLDWEDPREISFQPGQRRLWLDEESFLLDFNEDFTSVNIGGELHRIRFGAPTRELFIDDFWFECFFGGPPVPILLGGKVRLLKLEGPAPQVSIGAERRTDLVAGTIKLIVDATTILPLFLDAKPQVFFIGSVPHTLRFVDSLQTILINECPFKVEFGGLPKPIYVHKRKHFIRISVLPNGIKAGEAYIANMEGVQPTAPPPAPVPEPALSPAAADPAPAIPPAVAPAPALDMLASIMPSGPHALSGLGSYSIAPPDLSVPPPATNINVGDLFAKLVASGILGSAGAAVPLPPPSKSAPVPFPPFSAGTPQDKSSGRPPPALVMPVNLLKPETLKVRQAGLVSALHAGMQCGSCGARFPPEHTVRYSQHLDWHFRQNRADRDSQRRPHSRPWHYDVPDWLRSEEIEDPEEREKSWFERQREEQEPAPPAGAEGAEAPPEEGAAAPPPSAPPHQMRCPHCGDRFHQFYNQESEEWQLRRAVAYLGDNYHPQCLQEYKAAQEEKEAAASASTTQEEPSALEEPEVEPEEEPSLLEEEIVAEEEDDEDEVQLVEEDDDVVIKSEPVVQIVVEDADTDEETERERAARDARPHPPDFSNVKIKQEPMDPDDEPIITAEEVMTATADTTHAAVVSSIDGNVQLEPAHFLSPPGSTPRIRINITSTAVVASAEPPPPGEEETEPCAPPPAPPSPPPIPAAIKPALLETHLRTCPPEQRGQELSALCSIM